jgi:hypothetical protein
MGSKLLLLLLLLPAVSVSALRGDMAGGGTGQELQKQNAGSPA